MPIEAITQIWRMVVTLVIHIATVAYWRSYVAYSDLVMVAKSMQGSYYDLRGRFNHGSKSAKVCVRSLTSQVQ